MAIPTKGIHVQSAMRYLFRRLITNDISAVPYPRADMYDANPHHFGGGSENMKLLYSAVGYIASHPAGRERLINWYANEQGHGGGEPLTMSHCQLHIGGHAAIALHAHQNQDYQVRDLAIRWLSIEYYLLSLCSIDAEPWTPGARGVVDGKAEGENLTRGLFIKAVRGQELTKKVKGKLKTVKPNQYDLGAFCIARLPLEVRDWIAKAPDTSMFTIQGDLSITRAEDGSFAAVFDTLPIGGGGVQAAGFNRLPSLLGGAVDEKWIYRDANTPEAARAIGRVTSKARVKPIRFKSLTIKPKPIKPDKPIKPITDSLTSSTPPVPTTCTELFATANLPYREGNALISRADPSLVASCFKTIYPNFGYGFMHASDHHAALLILLNREPTYREVQDSYHLGGSRNIDAARIKSGAGERPSGWDNWTDFQKRVAILTHLYGMSRGGRIADGKIADPDPERTKALMLLWGMKVDTEPEKPIDPIEPDKPIEPEKPPIDPPVDPDKPPVDPPVDDISIEITLTINGVVRKFKGIEIK